MPAFSYTSGDISHLTPGGAASMTDLQGPFTDVRTALNGNLDEVNVPNMAAAFTTWKTILWGGAVVPTQGAGVTALMSGGPTAQATANIAAAGTAGTAAWAFYLDPADWLANARQSKLRVRWECIVNSVAPAQNFVPGLYPVATWGGGSGVTPTVASAGTVVSGSTGSFATPGASSAQQSLSTEFNFPAAGWYVFGVVVGGGMAAGSQVIVKGDLQMRQV